MAHANIQEHRRSAAVTGSEPYFPYRSLLAKSSVQSVKDKGPVIGHRSMAWFSAGFRGLFVRCGASERPITRVTQGTRNLETSAPSRMVRPVPVDHRIVGTIADGTAVSSSRPFAEQGQGGV